jgi:hypothetical protein
MAASSRRVADVLASARLEVRNLEDKANEIAAHGEDLRDRLAVVSASLDRLEREVRDGAEA